MKNNYEIRGDVSAIFINTRIGEVHEFIVDTSELPSILSHPYAWTLTGSGKMYAGAPNKGGGSKTIRLHRFIMNPPDDMMIDHINGDTKDNRRCNLREVTSAQNQQNRFGSRSDSKTGIRGVSWNKVHKSWTAHITINGKFKSLGQFENKEEAVRIATEARAKLMPFSKEARENTDTSEFKIPERKREYKNNRSGYNGVSWHKQHQKWYAYICLNKKVKFLGLFDDKLEAAKVAQEAKKQQTGT